MSYIPDESSQSYQAGYHEEAQRYVENYKETYHKNKFIRPFIEKKRSLVPLNTQIDFIPNTSVQQTRDYTEIRHDYSPMLQQNYKVVETNEVRNGVFESLTPVKTYVPPNQFLVNTKNDTPIKKRANTESFQQTNDYTSSDRINTEQTFRKVEQEQNQSYYLNEDNQLRQQSPAIKQNLRRSEIRRNYSSNQINQNHSTSSLSGSASQARLNVHVNIPQMRAYTPIKSKVLMGNSRIISPIFSNAPPPTIGYNYYRR